MGKICSESAGPKPYSTLMDGPSPDRDVEMKRAEGEGEGGEAIPQVVSRGRSPSWLYILYSGDRP